MAGVALGLQDARKTENQSPVILVKSADRKSAIPNVIQSLGNMDCQGKDIYLKCNFNSADSFPASTHLETLTTVVESLKGMSCGRIRLVERSGMGTTRDVMQKLGVLEAARRLNIDVLPLEDLAPGGWRHEELPGSHWKNGIEVPAFLRDGPMLVQVCNLKTHRFGGQFSASLKNSVGLVAKYSPRDPTYNYMAELHNSPDQRPMIAEINQVYKPSFSIMDATGIFITDGPEKGELAFPQVIAASRDRVALDAVGLAILRIFGAALGQGRVSVFEQDTIKRAAELKLGAASEEEIQLVTMDPAGALFAFQVKSFLAPVVEDKKSRDE